VVAKAQPQPPAAVGARRPDTDVRTVESNP
jgi:hypothetical protein